MESILKPESSTISYSSGSSEHTASAQSASGAPSHVRQKHCCELCPVCTATLVSPRQTFFAATPCHQLGGRRQAGRSGSSKLSTEQRRWIAGCQSRAHSFDRPLSASLHGPFERFAALGGNGVQGNGGCHSNVQGETRGEARSTRQRKSTHKAHREQVHSRSLLF